MDLVTDAPNRRFTAHGPGTPAEVWRARLAPGTREPLSLDGVRRLVVVGAHPDDESLGAGGLIASARAAGIPVHLVCATDGEGSHPDSPTHPPEALAARRVAEWEAAARELGVGATERHRLGLTDGGLRDRVPALTTALVDLVGDGRGTVLVATWSQDGHPDHAAVGRAAGIAARRTDAQLWEFPIWFWHWADPDDPRVPPLRPLTCDEAAYESKWAAIAAHRSQVEALSSLAGDEVLLTPGLLAHFEGPEWFVVTPGRHCPDDALDDLHRASADPWGTDSRWYERRKRDLLLATLPRPRFRHVLEVGCSTGTLTGALADRADRVLGIDRSVAALQAARRRLADREHVVVADLDVATSWPEEGPFDLVVVSEVGYFLSPAAVDGLVDRIASALAPDGVVALCHWVHRVEGWVLDADDVHRRFADGSLPPLQATYRDRDLEIHVHAADWPDHEQ
ncbi:MAG TPA: PIG-L family deacetylase [Nocardioides sp.]|nr:PIG-L family deacetylase [Nocardioides sp.]